MPFVTLAFVFILGSVSYGQPAEVVRDSSRELLINFTVDQPHWQKTGSGFVLDIKGFTQHPTPNQKSAPVVSKLISIPIGSEPKIEILKIRKSEIVLPGPLADFSLKDCHGQSVDQHPQHAILSLRHESQLGPVRVGLLSFSPLINKGKQIELVENLVARVSFEQSIKKPISQVKLSERAYKLLRTLVVNKAGLGHLKTKPDRGYRLIIAPLAFKELIARWIQITESRGLSVAAQFYPTLIPAKINRTIAKFANSNEPPETIQVVGDATTSIAEFSNHLDSGPFPDIQLGYLPTRSPEDLQNYIERIASRRAGEDLTKNIVLFSDGTPQTTKTASFAPQLFKRSAHIDIETLTLNTKLGHHLPDLLRVWPKIDFMIYDGAVDNRGLTHIPLFMPHFKQLPVGRVPVLAVSSCNTAPLPTSFINHADFAAIVHLTHPTQSLVLPFLQAAFFDETSPKEPHHGLDTIGEASFFALTNAVLTGVSTTPKASHISIIGDPSVEILPPMESYD